MDKYVIVCDESTKHGKRYSYFYGGAMVKEKDYEFVNEELLRLKHILVLNEIKRNHISYDNADKYIEVLKKFFEFVRQDIIKVRIMFCKNIFLNNKQKEKSDCSFNKFYYFFLKFGFSLQYINQDISLRILFDVLPDNKEKNNTFKDHLVKKLNITPYYSNNHYVYLEKQNIEEVDSKKHLILQCVDVLTGIMDFFLNDYISYNYCDSKKSKGRYKVLNYILNNINDIDPSFNYLITTKSLLTKKSNYIKYAHYLYKPKKLINQSKTLVYKYIKNNPFHPTSIN